MRSLSPGWVAIVGAGPGDPGLLTLAAARAIAEADVILYDALVAPAILRGARPEADLLFVGKRAASHVLRQPEIEALMVERARAGQRVVRLKGGDPFVFGRGGEEALACRRAGVPFTIIPGVTSAIAGPAYAGIPVTHRGLSGDVHFVTATPGDEGSAVDWEAAARAGTLVVLMGASNLAEVAERLLAAGRSADTPAACIRWGTRPEQEVVVATLGTVAAAAREAGLASPLVTVVGPVAALAQEIGWFEPGPLAGKSVVVTRGRGQAGRLAGLLEAEGAAVIEAPVIRVVLRSDDHALRSAVSRAHDWIAFASVNGVEAVMAALSASGHDSRALAGSRLAAIGAATSAALGRFGLRPDFVPAKATATVLAAELPLAPGERVLLPSSSLADDTLRAALTARGAVVEAAVAYDNVVEDLDPETSARVASADAITFTSASTARNLAMALGGSRPVPGARLVSIGPETSAAVRQAFGRVDAEAAEPSLAALVEAVVSALAARDGSRQ